MGNIPHGGHDLLLYKIAKELGIKTFVLFQIPIPPRFMILNTYENFDDLLCNNFMEEDINNKLLKIEPPIYMKKINTKVKGNYKQLYRLLKKRKYEEFLYNLIDRLKEKQFNIEICKHLNEIPEIDKYIYFPLHLQPEMTTSSLDNEYVD